MTTTVTVLTEKEVQEAIKKNYSKAETIINNEDKVEKILRKLEKKLKELPLGLSSLSYVPVMGSLIKSYIEKRYTEIPIATLAYSLVAILYVVSPIDLIPDSIGVIGYFDDAAFVAGVLPFIKKDLDDYLEWRNLNDLIVK